MPKDSLVTTPRTDLEVAVALLMAAITFRDLLSAMGPQVVAAMPSDLLNRVGHHRYQSAFDLLPAEIRTAAQDIVLADPDIIEARHIDAQARW